jgi:hypothetical protein
MPPFLNHCQHCGGRLCACSCYHALAYPVCEDCKRRWLMGHSSSPATWERYELRKRELQCQGLTQHEYELAVRRLADELEV